MADIFTCDSCGYTIRGRSNLPKDPELCPKCVIGFLVQDDPEDAAAKRRQHLYDNATLARRLGPRPEGALAAGDEDDWDED